MEAVLVILVFGSLAMFFRGRSPHKQLRDRARQTREAAGVAERRCDDLQDAARYVRRTRTSDTSRHLGIGYVPAIRGTDAYLAAVDEVAQAADLAWSNSVDVYVDALNRASEAEGDLRVALNYSTAIEAGHPEAYALAYGEAFRDQGSTDAVAHAYARRDAGFYVEVKGVK